MKRESDWAIGGDGSPGYKPRAVAHSDSGVASAVSVALFVPVLFAVMELMMLSGRIVDARADVATAAREAARAATTRNVHSDAEADVQTVAARILADRGAECVTTAASMAGSDWRPGGRVHVTVSCRVRLSDLSNLAIGGGSMMIESTGVEPIDPYRSMGSNP